MMNLASELAAHLRFKERLLADYPDVAEEDLADTLAGASCLEEALVFAIRQAHADECAIEAIETRIAKLKERANRLQGRAETIRARVAEAMDQAGLKRLPAPDFTATLKATGPRVIVTDESLIPEDYWKPQPPKLDKALVKRALSDGYAVAGATLSNGGQTLSIRVG